MSIIQNITKYELSLFFLKPIKIKYQLSQCVHVQLIDIRYYWIAEMIDDTIQDKI